ncbi:hypothetical protein ACFWPA_09410 [Rhodococcus sp. NPDC058505]|uniref:hypothetical protein n=1 Tax=Rhodococcus sp. NPDC058505 TaxID=3346531 RepID=UPI0036535E61
MRHNSFLRIVTAAGAVTVIGLGFPGTAAAGVDDLSISKFGKAGTGCPYELTASLTNVPPAAPILFRDGATALGAGVKAGDVATIDWTPATTGEHTLYAGVSGPAPGWKELKVDVGRGIDLGSTCMGM